MVIYRLAQCFIPVKGQMQLFAPGGKQSITQHTRFLLFLFTEIAAVLQGEKIDLQIAYFHIRNLQPVMIGQPVAQLACFFIEWLLSQILDEGSRKMDNMAILNAQIGDKCSQQDKHHGGKGQGIDIRIAPAENTAGKVLDLVIGNLQPGKYIGAVTAVIIPPYDINKHLIAIVTQHQLQQKITYILFLAFHTDSVVVLAMQCDFEGFQILCQGENVLVNGGTGYKQLFTQLIDAAAVKGTQLHPDKNFTCLWGIIGKRFIFLPYTFQYVQLVPDFTVNTDTDAGFFNQLEVVFLEILIHDLEVIANRLVGYGKLFGDFINRDIGVLLQQNIHNFHDSFIHKRAPSLSLATIRVKRCSVKNDSGNFMWNL